METKSTKRELCIKLFENGKYLPSYDKSYYYDAGNDESFNAAHITASYQIMSVCRNNPNITARIEFNKQ